MNREDLLKKAMSLTTGKRDVDYGSPGANFLRTAKLWSAYTGHDISPHEVAVMMVLLKISRIRHDETKADNFIDGAGYMAIAAEVCGAKDEEQENKEQKKWQESTQETRVTAKSAQ